MNEKSKNLMVDVRSSTTSMQLVEATQRAVEGIVTIRDEAAVLRRELIASEDKRLTLEEMSQLVRLIQLADEATSDIRDLRTAALVSVSKSSSALRSLLQEVDILSAQVVSPGTIRAQSGAGNASTEALADRPQSHSQEYILPPVGVGNAASSQAESAPRQADPTPSLPPSMEIPSSTLEKETQESRTVMLTISCEENMVTPGKAQRALLDIPGVREAAPIELGMKRLVFKLRLSGPSEKFDIEAALARALPEKVSSQWVGDGSCEVRLEQVP